MSKARLPWLILLVILFGGVYLWAREGTFQQERLSTITSFSDGSTGLSVFQEVSRKFASKPISRKLSPLLLESELAGKNGLAVFSPLLPPSPSESKLILKFVESGGTLVLGFHDRASWESIQPLLSRAPLRIRVHDDPSFENRATVLASPRTTENTDLLMPSEKYAFYSQLVYDRPLCEAPQSSATSTPAAECYFETIPFYKGRIVLMAGLPILANAMIWRADNRQVALRLAQTSAPLVIDEYHHFFTDKTWWGFLRKWRVSLPILVMIIGLLLQFAFGRSESDDLLEMSLDETERERAGSYHALHQDIVSHLIGSPSAVPAAISAHRDFLERMYPMHSESIREAAEPNALLELHRRIKSKSRGSVQKEQEK